MASQYLPCLCREAPERTTLNQELEMDCNRLEITNYMVTRLLGNYAVLRITKPYENMTNEEY